MSRDEFHLFLTYSYLFGNKHVKSKLSISRVFLMLLRFLIYVKSHILTWEDSRWCLPVMLHLFEDRTQLSADGAWQNFEVLEVEIRSRTLCRPESRSDLLRLH